MEEGYPLGKPCPNKRHGIRGISFALDEWEHDPQCSTCGIQAIMAEHDHLHLDGAECLAPGLTGKPGVNVKCRCGSYHH